MHENKWRPACWNQVKPKIIDAWPEPMENFPMHAQTAVFSLTYAEARAKFLEAAQAAGLDVTSAPAPSSKRPVSLSPT